MGAWRVWISDQAGAALIEAAAAAHPTETGGVLVGVLVAQGRGAGRPWVTHAVEVLSTKRGPAHYELPARGRERVVKRLRKRDYRLGYLGDWHSHPANIGPSPTDADTMASISRTGDCAQPLLFVLRRIDTSYEIEARQWTGAALRQLQTRASGPLLAADVQHHPERKVMSSRWVRRSVR